jgi:PhzF family phenazine biosynthesis protein
MSRRIRIFQVDAFTPERFTGNPAGVVLDADSLADAEMLAIARELNNADTAFVLKPDGADHELRVRFFTPRTEAGFVGHATVATHFVLSRDGLAHPAANGRIRQRQKSGLVDIEVRGEKEVASTPSSPASTGATSGSGTLGTPKGASSGASPASGSSK